MDSSYVSTHSEAVQAVYREAVSGEYRNLDLEAIRGRLWMAGATLQDTEQILDDLASRRRLETLRPYIRRAHAQMATKLTDGADGRLNRALDLALNGAVQLLGDDRATVRSQHGAATTYAVDDRCNCPDAQTSAPMVDGHPACKHLIAVWMVRKAEDLMTVEA